MPRSGSDSAHVHSTSQARHGLRTALLHAIQQRRERRAAALHTALAPQEGRDPEAGAAEEQAPLGGGGTPEQHVSSSAGGEQASAVTVLLIDQRPLMREGMRSTLETAGFSVVGEAAGQREALSLSRALRPRVIVLGVQLADGEQLTAVGRLKKAHTGGAVVVVAADPSPELLVRLVGAGADACLSQAGERHELVDLVRRTSRRERVFDEAVLRSAVRALAWPDRRSRPSQSKTGRAPNTLTEREIEVLVLIARGLTNVGIAQVLSLAPGTVKIHVQNIMQKLGVNDRTEAVTRAMHDHLI